MDIDGDGGRRDLRMKDKPHQLRRLSIRWSSSSQRLVSLPPADSTPPLSVEISCLCAPALFDTPGNEVTLGRQGGEIFGLAKTRERGGDLTEFGSERATDGVVEMVALQRCALLDAVERVQPDLCAVDTGDGDGTVHRSDG